MSDIKRGANSKSDKGRSNVKSLRGVCCGYGFLVFWMIFLCVVEAPATETPGANMHMPQGPSQKHFQYDPASEIQNEFLRQMRDIDKNLKDAHANFAKNYTMISDLYERLQTDWRSGSATPQHVMVNLQNLLREKENIQTGIGELDKKKAALTLSISSHYDQNIPGALQRALDEEEKKYKADIDEIYLQLGWWLQTQKSGFGAREEMLLRRNILRHYDERGRAEE